MTTDDAPIVGVVVKVEETDDGRQMIVVQTADGMRRIMVPRPTFYGTDPVGIAEVAERLHVHRGTVDNWRTRGLMPEPRWIIGGRPAWDWPDIERWHEEHEERKGNR